MKLAEALQERADTVSYTHLDVYKRQALQQDKFQPYNCDEPLLWSLARMGLYPRVSSQKQGGDSSL